MLTALKNLKIILIVKLYNWLWINDFTEHNKINFHGFSNDTVLNAENT